MTSSGDWMTGCLRGGRARESEGARKQQMDCSLCASNPMKCSAWVCVWVRVWVRVWVCVWVRVWVRVQVRVWV